MAILLAGDEFRKCFADAYGFLVEGGVDTAHNHNVVVHRAVFFDDKLNYHAALDAIFDGRSRISEIFVDEFHQCRLSSGKFRHLFHRAEHNFSVMYCVVGHVLGFVSLKIVGGIV